MTEDIINKIGEKAYGKSYSKDRIKDELNNVLTPIYTYVWFYKNRKSLSEEDLKILESKESGLAVFQSLVGLEKICMGVIKPCFGRRVDL